MKYKGLIIISCIFISFAALYGKNTDKEFILSFMKYPEPDLTIGNLINNPFFGLNLKSGKNNPEIIKKMITKIEKDAEAYSDQESLYKLGNLYKELREFESAVKNYKLCLQEFDKAGNNTEYYKELKTKGEIYFLLSEIDLNSDRTGNLEKSSFFFLKAIEIKPEKDLWIMLGDCYLALSKNNEALYCYQRALEKDGKISFVYARLQAASFQMDFLKFMETVSKEKMRNIPVSQVTDFEYIQTAVNASVGQDKNIMKMQHYIYLLRLLLVKYEFYKPDGVSQKTDYNTIFTDEEKSIIKDAELFINESAVKNIEPSLVHYLKGIVRYLMSDFNNAILNLKESLKGEEYSELINKEILFIVSEKMNDEKFLIKFLKDKISQYPDASDYLLLGGIEFKNNNFSKAEMLCNQALKINKYYPEAYSALGVIYAFHDNYIAADEMIKNGNYLVQKSKKTTILLKNQMKVNEAAVALLKNEKERAYILLRSVLSVDNDEKVYKLYNRYYNKNGKIQN